MVLAVFVWWYTTGWSSLAARVMERADHTLEMFSVGLLLKTLFAPFRQISAGSVHGSFDAQMRAFGDRLFSRVFGAVIRSFFIVIGLVSTLLASVIGIVQLVLWPLVPLLPVVGIVAAVLGWRIG